MKSELLAVMRKLNSNADWDGAYRKIIMVRILLEHIGDYEVTREYLCTDNGYKAMSEYLANIIDA